jgi:hypothetical protein
MQPAAAAAGRGDLPGSPCSSELVCLGLRAKADSSDPSVVKGCNLLLWALHGRPGPFLGSLLGLLILLSGGLNAGPGGLAARAGALVFMTLNIY